MASQEKLTFPESLRLKMSHEFKEVRETGKRKIKGCLILNWKVLPEGGESRLGVITTKKLGKAHDRSRARRLMRETFRLQQHRLKASILVLIARNSILSKSQPEVEKDFLLLAREAGILKTE
ncbi:MAG: ribonuclease P protein component [Verrucomicrobiota bacterium]|nr:ribonuclease P protein component [Verrucomicrobiota bacterium]